MQHAVLVLRRSEKRYIWPSNNTGSSIQFIIVLCERIRIGTVAKAQSTVIIFAVISARQFLRNSDLRPHCSGISQLHLAQHVQGLFFYIGLPPSRQQQPKTVYAGTDLQKDGGKSGARFRDLTAALFAVHQVDGLASPISTRNKIVTREHRDVSFIIVTIVLFSSTWLSPNPA